MDFKREKFNCSFFSIIVAVIEWSPRMDVAESGQNYVISIEIPGVTVKDIRVEVDDKK